MGTPGIFDSRYRRRLVLIHRVALECGWGLNGASEDIKCTLRHDLIGLDACQPGKIATKRVPVKEPMARVSLAMSLSCAES
jgi:hypothetical protein